MWWRLVAGRSLSAARNRTVLGRTAPLAVGPLVRPLHLLPREEGRQYPLLGWSGLSPDGWR